MNLKLKYEYTLQCISHFCAGFSTGRHSFVLDVHWNL
jgi:hypothetical protein